MDLRLCLRKHLKMYVHTWNFSPRLKSFEVTNNTQPEYILIISRHSPDIHTTNLETFLICCGTKRRQGRCQNNLRATSRSLAKGEYLSRLSSRGWRKGLVKSVVCVQTIHVRPYECLNKPNNA